MPLCVECVSSNLWHGRYQRAGGWPLFGLCFGFAMWLKLRRKRRLTSMSLMRFWEEEGVLFGFEAAQPAVLCVCVCVCGGRFVRCVCAFLLGFVWDIFCVKEGL